MTRLLAVLVAAASMASPDGIAAETRGRPILRTFTTTAGTLNRPNWAVTQDPDGVVYVASDSGVFEFDGEGWRLFHLANGSIARALAVAGPGVVWVGGVGEVGVLRRAATGRLDYTPLSDHGGHLEDLRDVWRLWATDDGFVAWTFDRLLAWNGATFTSWPVSGRQVPGLVGDSLLHVDDDAHLRLLIGDRLQLVGRLVGHGGERIVAWFQRADGSLLVGTRQGHLWRVPIDQALATGAAGPPREIRLARVATEVDALLESSRLYHGLVLASGDLVLATMDAGAVIIDPQGRLLHHLDREAGLPDDSVWFVSEDGDGGLWLALNRGLARASLGRPFTVFREDLGLEGLVEALALGRGHLWAGTSRGLFRLDDDRFRRIEGVPGPCWAVLATPGEGGEEVVLAGAADGVFAIGDDGVRTARPSRHAYSLAASSWHPGLVWVGEADGLAAVELHRGRWRGRPSALALNAEIRSIAEAADGSLWLGTLANGVVHVTGPVLEDLGQCQVTRLGTESGLRSMASTRVFTLDGAVHVASPSGLDVWDPSAARFTESQRFGRSIGGILRVARSDDGCVWLSRYDKPPVRIDLTDDGAATVVSTPFARMAGIDIPALLPDADGGCWLGTDDGLYRIHGRLGNTAIRDRPDLHLLLREISVDDQLRPLDERPLELASARQRVAFQWVAPTFDGDRISRYRHRLRGLDPEWSPWSDRTEVEYLSLPGGRFTFEIQARGLDRQVLDTVRVPLRVPEPWFLTWPAFLLWGALTATAVWVGAAVRSRKLERDRDRLEGEVAERTRELREHALSLEEARAELEAFAYSVSHDLRAPLRRIDGFSQALLEDLGSAVGDDGRFLIERLRSNTARMNELISALLDLSRINRHELSPAAVDLSALAREVVAELAEAEPEREVEVEISPGLTVRGDGHLLRALLANLIGNAWKFTAHRRPGRISLTAEEVDGERHLTVADNGAGFDPRYAERLFSPFQRLHGSDEFPGTGIGLATVQRIVRRHGGRVWAEGRPDRGATFRFTLGED